MIHATAVARHGRAVLLLGPSGSGKSDLALRLLDRGWSLVSDDYVQLAVEHGRLIARPPAAIRGRLEVRGIGIISVPHLLSSPVALVADLAAAPDRLPKHRTHIFQGIAIPLIALEPFAASACIKLELAFAGAAKPLEDG